MSKYMGWIIVGVFLLAILIGVFWNWIIQVGAIADGVAIIFGLILLSILVRGLLYKHVDWSKPNIFVRPFLPPMGSEKPHRLTDQNEWERKERQED
jgi:hypothetical protein